MRMLSAICSSVLVLALSGATVGTQASFPPLTPAMKCSACEVTAREIYKKYNERSSHDKFSGTEVEVAEVVQESCDRVSSVYRVGQESFGAHLKVFADTTSKYDMSNVEAPEFFSEKDANRYKGAHVKLFHYCQELVGEFEELIVQHIVDRSEERTVREMLCTKQTDVCTEARLAKFKKKESAKRKRWKRKAKGKQSAEKLERELNDEGMAAWGDTIGDSDQGTWTPQIEASDSMEEL